MSSLKSKTVKGLSWNLVGTVAGSGISFLVGIILARILNPVDFGLVGMVTVLLAIATTLTDSGIVTGLIRQPNVSQEDYSTAFYLNLAIGIGCYLLLFFGAPLIATFFEEPRLVAIVRVASLIIIVNALGFAPQAVLTRNLSFDRLSIASMTSSILSGIISIVAARNGAGYWSLILLVVLRQVFNTIMLWLLSKWHPIKSFSKTSLRRLYSFGYKVLIASLISTFQQNIYYLIIGKYFSSTTLGLYNRAESFTSIATSNISGTFSKVFFPALSTIQTEESRFRQSISKINCLTFFISTTIMFFLAALAEPLILLLIGPKWTESIYMLQLLCMASITMPLNSLNRDMLLIKGHSHLLLRLQLEKLVLFLPAIWIAFAFNVTGLLYYSIFSSIVAFFINSRFAWKFFQYSAWQQLADIAPYFVISLCAGLSMWTVDFIELSALVQLVIKLTVGSTVTLLLIIVVSPPHYRELYLIISDTLTKKRIVTDEQR